MITLQPVFLVTDNEANGTSIVHTDQGVVGYHSSLSPEAAAELFPAYYASAAAARCLQLGAIGPGSLEAEAIVQHSVGYDRSQVVLTAEQANRVAIALTRWYHEGRAERAEHARQLAAGELEVD